MDVTPVKPDERTELPGRSETQRKAEEALQRAQQWACWLETAEQARKSREDMITNRKYEIVEKDKNAQYELLSALADNPAQQAVYLFMMAGEPLSSADIADFLRLWLAGHFDKAFDELQLNGLIRSAA